MSDTTLDSLISFDPAVRSGQPLIAGTGVAVRTVVGYYKLGMHAEEIADEMDQELAGVHAALAFYHTNRSEIEADLASNKESVVMEEILNE